MDSQKQFIILDSQSARKGTGLFTSSPHSPGLRPLSGPLPKNRYDNDDDNDDDNVDDNDDYNDDDNDDDDDDDDDGDDNSNLSVRWFVTHFTKTQFKIYSREFKYIKESLWHFATIA